MSDGAVCHDYDVIIIGGGPGGYTAAIRGSQLGLRICLVEREHVGGTCLNRGCIPTKAWVASARALEMVRKVQEFGIDGIDDGLACPNMEKVTSRASSISNRLRQGIELLLRKRGVALIRGEGTLGPDGLVVDGSTLRAPYYIIATGSLPNTLPVLLSNSSNIFNSEEILSIKHIPKRLLIIGGGVIGAEFASIFNTFGSEVTLIDILPELLTGLDRDVRRHIALRFKRRGIRFIGSTKVTDCSDMAVKLDNGETILPDAVLVAIGRKPETSSLDLDGLGIQTDRKGFILTGEDMATSNKAVYAVGDVTGHMLLAHVAAGQGLEAIMNITRRLGKDTEKTQNGLNYDYIPSCVFTEPEIAVVGLSEDEALVRGYDIETGRFPYSASGKAVADAEGDGFVKIVADRNSKAILGIHIVGNGASDLIAEGTLAVQHRINLMELSATIHAHPTLSEMIVEAAEAVFGKAIHTI